MEKISGACASGWSIQLEKGLRSTKPGCLIESIRQIGPRLSRWNREPQLTMDVCDIFGLVPGEDRLFADAILFRIVDAFVSGDKDIRISIAKLFLLTLKQCKTKGPTHGIYSNMIIENRLELLKRVKAVLHVNCVKSRASTFILFGCWADFAKDVAEIRDAVFLSLTSRHILEVKASLFAAGCFSEISVDFGYVFLEKLLTLIVSQATFRALRIAGARSFAKIGCSLLLAVRSYKAGSKLLQKISEEDVLATMLMALTKISLNTSILISDQVVLLCSFLSQTRSTDMQARVLRCLRLICENSACFVPASAFSFQCLFEILDEQSTPSALHCEIFQIFLKMIAHGLPDRLLKDTDEFMKLLRCVENATRSPFLSVRLLAFESFVCISTKLKRTESMSEADLANLSSSVAATVLDQVTVLSNRLSGGESRSEVGDELGRMLRLLLVLAADNSKLGYLILDKLNSIIENFVNLHNPAVEAQKFEPHKVVDIGAEGNVFSQRVLMFHIHRFLVAFVEAGVTTEQVVSKLKYLICLVCDSSLFDCSIHTFYALIWHSHKNQSHLLSENQKSSTLTEGVGRFPIKLLEHENIIHMCGKNMLEGGDNWSAYKAGKYAACEGVWDVANFIFDHLVKRVQSDAFCQWLKLLVQLTNCEKNVEVLLHQNSVCLPSNRVLKPHTLDNSFRKTNSSGNIEQLAEICAAILGSDKVLEAISAQTHAFYFQRWFLALRLRLLLLMLDILKVLDKFLLYKNYESTKNLIGMSSRLASLAEEFDLVTSAFIDMDSTSLKIMSDLALICSMLAFFTEFTTLIIIQNPTEAYGDCLNVIVKDLVGRLWHVDPEICINLLSLLKDNGVHDRFGVKRIIELRHQSLNVANEDAVLQLCRNGMESLLQVVKAWMQIPWRIPKYFFRVRRTMGSLLFWSSTGVRKQREIISISPGSHLQLNLCIQLKDMPSDFSSSFSKLYCILYCRKSPSAAKPSGEPMTQSHVNYRASEIDTMIHLNKNLQCYIIKQSREFIKCKDLHNAGDDVEAFVCFETNGRRQGFSTCLLDVSAFPVGSYSIDWHSGGIDRHGAYWSFLPLCRGPQFSVR
ncbi:uncharacterized protein LOC141646613 isoform X2 [Silene latifolia]|uniref:uncharacterized protein LOC141646613 isoform X2 n=1 Tax=Silene latifolia TaxID=37657 RepID=UPI003D78AE39